MVSSAILSRPLSRRDPLFQAFSLFSFLSFCQFLGYSSQPYTHTHIYIYHYYYEMKNELHHSSLWSAKHVNGHRCAFGWILFWVLGKDLPSSFCLIISSFTFSYQFMNNFTIIWLSATKPAPISLCSSQAYVRKWSTYDCAQVYPGHFNLGKGASFTKGQGSFQLCGRHQPNCDSLTCGLGDN